MAKRHDYRSAQAAEYRPLYATARWKAVRAHQKKIEPLCRMCLAIGQVTPMAVCDHIDPKSKRDPDPSQMFRSACEMKLEGIVSKKLKSKYVSGRGGLWTNTKC